MTTALIGFAGFVAKYLLTHEKNRKTMEKCKGNGNKELQLSLMKQTYDDLVGGFSKKFGIEFKINGCENVPEGPVLFVANHSGMVDAAIMAEMPIPVGFVLKKEFAKIPLFTKWLGQMNAVFMDRENPREAVNCINECVDIINNGFSMAIFPEGTRTRDASVGEFKNGAFKIVQKTGVPIVPVAIKGSYKVWEEPGKIIPGTVTAQIMEPVYTDNLDRKAYKALGVTIREKIVNQLDNM